MTSFCKMLRIMLLPLLLFTLSMACMGQTFQYSRGWTNGKRSSPVLAGHFHHDEESNMPEMYEIQDGLERKLERCLVQLQRFVRNPFLLHTATSYTGAGALSINPNTNANTNNNNPNSLYGNHHQSNELFEELNAVEPNDYVKH